MSSIPVVEEVVVPPAAAEDIVQGQVVGDVEVVGEVGQVEGEVDVVVHRVDNDQVVDEDVVDKVNDVVAQWYLV
jgi:hypothetical protein